MISIAKYQGIKCFQIVNISVNKKTSTYKLKKLRLK